MKRIWFSCLLILPFIASAKGVKIHGYVTAVHNQTSFEIDDYHIRRDESVTLDFDTDDDDSGKSERAGKADKLDYPKDIRVGAEIEIKGEFNEETRELKAKSVKVYTRESKNLKRTALINQIPALVNKGSYWEGNLRLDGQQLVIDETTKVMIVPNSGQKKAAKEAAKQAKKAKVDKKQGPEPDAEEETPVDERALTQLSDVHVNMYASYEGYRQPDGRVQVKKIQFRDNEMTGGEARMWKSLRPSVKGFKGLKPGELKLGNKQKFKTMPEESVQAYVRKLGERLIPASQKQLPDGDPNKIPFQFHVVEEKYVNAFAAPNGVVVVTAPMLALLENEAQLASVLGHEIAHATQEHTLRQQEFHKKKRMAMSIGTAVAAAYGNRALVDALTLVQAAIANGYQRYLENQADRIGMEYMLAAGYDPRQAPRVWKNMSMKMGGDSPTNVFWSSHDNNTTRRSYLMSELAINYREVNFDPLQKNSSEFDAMRGAVRDLYKKNKRIKIKF